MDKQKEKLYLKSKISSIVYDPKRFKVMTEGNKFIFGVISPKGEKTKIGKFMQFKTLYDTLMDLDWKTKFSFNKALELIDSDALNKFSIIQESTEEERLIYYYIENALFRTSSLWDILAQFYRLFYDIDEENTKVYYKKIFDPKAKYCKEFKDKAKKIYNYIHQADDSNSDKEWKGNHAFVDELRNKMTHRNSPNVATLSDFDMNFKDPPIVQLKRLIEDYAVVSKYIVEILDKVETKKMDFFDNVDNEKI